MSTPGPGLFRFVQVEVPWPLGPPEGRYLLRPREDPEAPPTHVIVFATLGAPERRRRGRRRARDAPPEPEPMPVSTGRATVIDVADSLQGPQARAWLEQAGEQELVEGLNVLEYALHAFRVVTADPYLQPLGRRQLLVARVGYGVGEQVADGLWAEAREIVLSERRQRRNQVLVPQSRLAAVLGGREPALACEELVLRTRLDVDHGREREAALQLLAALDAALAELPSDPAGPTLAERLKELRDQREAVAAAAESALDEGLSGDQRETVSFTLGRLEAALRARAAANV